MHDETREYARFAELHAAGTALPVRAATRSPFYYLCCERLGPIAAKRWEDENIILQPTALEPP